MANESVMGCADNAPAARSEKRKKMVRIMVFRFQGFGLERLLATSCKLLAVSSLAFGAADPAPRRGYWFRVSISF